MNTDKLSQHIEAHDGIIAQADAVQYMSQILNETMQQRLCNPRWEESKAGYVKAEFSQAEIDRLLWLAGEIQERGMKLTKQVDALYDELTAMQDADVGRKAA